MSRVYDDWERLVVAVLKREELQRIALCPSFSSCSSISSDLRLDPSSRRVSVANSATGVIREVAARLFAAPAIALAWYRRRKPENHFFDGHEDYPEFHLGLHERFSLSELHVATDNFSNKYIIGRDGFGKVYKGRLADGSLVAIKRMKQERSLEFHFQREVEVNSMVVHPNLLRLRGFCMTPVERLLVYPYMPNGTVASCLRERPESQAPLDWPIRKRIALESAMGLAHLHGCDPKIIHLNVKAANIFLDEGFKAVLGDFVLAELMDSKDTEVTTAVRGTIGHIAPEYLSTGRFSEKTDVFGYGVMLLEFITGQRVFDIARIANDDDVMLLDWKYLDSFHFKPMHEDIYALEKCQVRGILKEKKLETLVDADLQGAYVEEEVEQLIQVALLCTQSSPLERPNMSQVVSMLLGYGLAEWWKDWQNPEFDQRNTDRIIDDSTWNIHSEELSGPR